MAVSHWLNIEIEWNHYHAFYYQKLQTSMSFTVFWWLNIYLYQLSFDWNNTIRYHKSSVFTISWWISKYIYVTWWYNWKPYLIVYLPLFIQLPPAHQLCPSPVIAIKVVASMQLLPHTVGACQAQQTTQLTWLLPILVFQSIHKVLEKRKTEISFSECITLLFYEKLSVICRNDHWYTYMVYL